MKIIRLAILGFFLYTSAHAQDQKDTSFIYFSFDSDDLTTNARQQLQEFLEIFQNKPGNLTIYGHCDIKGSHEYNDRLSQKRTTVVKQWLKENGVAGEYITLVKGWGKRNPVNNNSSEDERSLNRRVEIIFDILKENPGQSNKPDTVKTFSQKTIETIKEGEKLVLPNINFQGGLHRFQPSALPSLKELLETLKSRPTLEIEIQGHICCRANSDVDGLDMETGGWNLSETRAMAVYDYLVENGINKSRMSFKGLAGGFPLIYPEMNEADRNKNRRVEILIIKK
jgi:outer membrane protein OmpA-like peptidoglycan-associated protein